MRKGNDIQGKLSICFSIPDEFVNDPNLAQEYVRELAIKLAKIDVMKDYHNVMIISDVEQTEEGEFFLDDKEYYEDYYGAIFPEDLD